MLRCRNECLPIGPLSPVFEGDTVVVKSGSVTVIDLSSGARQVLGAGSQITLSAAGKEESVDRWKLFRDAVIRALRGPDRKRTGGSVRGGEGSLWPDSALFGPNVVITFRWCGVHPEPSSLRLVRAGGETCLVPLNERGTSSGGAQWPEAASRRPGVVLWTLLDADSVSVGAGRLEILTAAAADSAKRRCLGEAKRDIWGDEQALGAALLAAARRMYLW